MYYFDWAATSPMSSKAIASYCNAAEQFIGNPSSSHPLGVLAHNKLEECRETIASLLGAKKTEVFFTSGGSESNAIVLNSLLWNPSPGEVITTAIEHSAVLEHKRILQKAGWKVTELPCPNGYLSPEVLQKALNPRVKMVCIMKVNNVTGTIQDTESFSSIIRNYSLENGKKIHIHCDAVQALGKIPLNLQKEDLDSVAFSAHKFLGPRGVGILVNRSQSVIPLSKGGGQEKGLRAGTENLAGICAMTTALEDAISSLNENYEKVKKFRAIIEEAATQSGFSILSPMGTSAKAYSPYIIELSTKGIPSEVFIRVMSDKGFCLSAGSACSANTKGKADDVLSAMNIPYQDRLSSVRVSFGCLNTQEEIFALRDALIQVKKDMNYGK